MAEKVLLFRLKKKQTFDSRLTNMLEKYRKQIDALRVKDLTKSTV